MFVAVIYHGSTHGQSYNCLFGSKEKGIVDWSVNQQERLGAISGSATFVSQLYISSIFLSGFSML
jgi:hypothetical protein